MAVNFLDQWKSPRGTIGKYAWDQAAAAGFSPQQIKVAVQQQSQAGTGINNAPGQFFHQGGPMRGVAGIASSENPMGRFQGPGGNMGLVSYMKAKQAGYSAQEIKEGAAAGGMFLPVRATAQYNMDMQAANERDQQLNYMQQLIDVVNRPQPRVGRSSSYVVGTGGAAELQANQRYKKAKEKYKGSKKWSREAFNAVNASAATGAGGGTVNP